MPKAPEQKNKRRGRAPGHKREQILQSAADYFGRRGYENTKWSEVAAAVGVGSTGLYHYFESKDHCLLEILDRAVGDYRMRLEAIVATHDDPTDALIAALADTYHLSEQEILQSRVLVAEQGMVAYERHSEREEEARLSARAGFSDLESAWGNLLARCMQMGTVIDADPKLVARAILGLHNSIWDWFRPQRNLALSEVAEYYMESQLRILGLPPERARAALADSLLGTESAAVGSKS